MRILFITQKIDQNDAVLGFVHGWLRSFSACFKKITVVCLEQGDYNLPKNIDVYSLGKECYNQQPCLVGRQATTNNLIKKTKYAFSFSKYIWKRRGEYDAVFVHMNPEYVLLGFLFWKILRKPVVLWYNHTEGGGLARLAFILTDKICHTSPYAFSAGRQKSVRMPAGIDTEVFKPSEKTERESRGIIFLGRISPLKDLRTLIEAAKLLVGETIDFELRIIGDPPARDLSYGARMKGAAAALVKSGHVFFEGAVPNREAPKVFSAAAANINLTPRGNYDKTVLEAMACGAISIVSSPAFRGVVPDEFIFKEKDPADLARKIKHVLSLSKTEREKIGRHLRQVVTEKESLVLLTDKLYKLLSSLPLKPRSFETNEVKKLISQEANKLFYIANARMPSEKAHAIQIAKMCEAFLEAEVDLKLILPDRGDGRSLKEFYGLRREVPVIRLPVLPFYDSGQFGYRLATLGFVKVALIYLWWQKILGVKARAHLIDMDQLSIGLAPLSPFPVTLEIHDAKPKTSWFSWIFKNVSRVLTINNIIKKKIVERFDLPPEKVLVFPNGIDLELFKKKFSKEEARRKLGLPLEGKFVMYAGQFWGWKGLEIFPEVAKLMPEVSFYLVGGTREEFEKVTKISGLPKNLIFAGKRPFTEIPLWLNAADVAVVLGTKRDEYSFYHTSPMKLFEYAAAEVPIIAAKTPAIADVVSTSEVFFYEPDNVQNLAEKLKEVLDNNGAVKSKILNALMKVQGLSWQKRVESIITLFTG